MREILHEALSLLENGEPFALVTLVAQQGSTPRAAGAQMLVRRDGSIAGTIGGGLLEATMMREAAEAIAAGRSQVSAVELTGQSVSGPTMICGGHAAVLVAFVPAGDGLRRLPHHRRFEQTAADGAGDGAVSPHEHLRPRGPRRGALLRDERDQGERLAVLKQAQRLVQDLTHGSADRRQPHRELRPALRAIGGLDDAALGLDETAGDGETEADALRAPRRLRAVEAVEDEGQVDGIDAGTAVGDRQGRPGAAGR